MQYVAVTKIEGGRTDENGNLTTFVFEPGETVQGLTQKEMKDLWDAGALRQVEDRKVEEPKEDSGDGSGERVTEPAG